MQKYLFSAIILISFFASGCETTEKVGNAAGSVVGEAANIPGSITDGGADAVRKKTTSEENPFGR